VTPSGMSGRVFTYMGPLASCSGLQG